MLRCSLFAVLVFGLLVGQPFALRAQQASRPPHLDDAIETDRDSFTPATTVTDPGLQIVESSYSFIDNASGLEGHSLPELLIRRGLNPWVEARFGYNWESGGTSNPISGEEFGDDDFTATPEARLNYGAKFQTSLPEGWVPRSAFIVEGFTPVSGEADATQIGVTEVWGWRLPNGWLWDSAFRFGTANERNEQFTLWAPSTVLKIPLGKRWNTHIEYFGTMSDDKAEAMSRHYISPGLHVLINPNFEVGIRIGWGLNQQSANFFTNVGLGVRF